MKNLYALLIAGVLGTTGHAQCTIPTLSDVSGPGTICSGNTASLTATTDGGSLHWFTQSTGGTQVGTGSPFVTPVLSGSTSYWVEARNSGTGTGTPTSGGGKLSPTSTGGTTITAATKPWGLAFTATSDFVLNSVDVFLTSSTPGNIVLFLQNSSYTTIQTITVAAPPGGTNTNPVQFTVPLNLSITGGNSYKLVVESCPAMIRDLGSGNNFPYAIGSVGTITGGTINNNGSNSGVYYFLYNWNFTPGSAPCVSARQQVMVTVNPTPALPTASAQTFCESGTVAGLSAMGTNLKWYSAPTGGTELTADTALASGTYYVSQSTATCESARTPVSVTVNPIPDAPSANAQAFCGTATVGALQANGMALKWYAGASGGSPLVGTTAITATGTYYVSQTAGTCESPRQPVNITINTIPDAPMAEAQTYCGGVTTEQLQANGMGLQWYADALGGAALTATAQLTAGTYYVSQTIGSCESGRTPVTININDIPDAPQANAQSFCGNANVGDLSPNGGELLWYESETGAPLTSFTALETGTYYVQDSADGCFSPFTAVEVTINPTPDAPAAAGQQTMNEGDTIADLDVAGENLTWYADAANAVELEETTLLEDSVTYYVMQTVNGCPSALVGITVNLVMGFGENTLAGLAYYPNPVENVLTLSNTITIDNISVYSILGQKIFNKEVNSESTTTDLTALPGGTYIVKVRSGNSVKNIRIAKK